MDHCKWTKAFPRNDNNNKKIKNQLIERKLVITNDWTSRPHSFKYVLFDLNTLFRQGGFDLG